MWFKNRKMKLRMPDGSHPIETLVLIGAEHDKPLTFICPPSSKHKGTFQLHCCGGWIVHFSMGKYKYHSDSCFSMNLKNCRKPTLWWQNYFAFRGQIQFLHSLPETPTRVLMTTIIWKRSSFPISHFGYLWWGSMINQSLNEVQKWKFWPVFVWGH